MSSLSRYDTRTAIRAFDCQITWRTSVAHHPTDVAARFGVARKTVHAWLARYDAEGLEGLADRSHRPRQPDSDVTVAELLDEYVPVGGWDASPRPGSLTVPVTLDARSSGW